MPICVAKNCSSRQDLYHFPTNEDTKKSGLSFVADQWTGFLVSVQESVENILHQNALTSLS